MEALRQHSSAWLFLQPVDADGLGIGHYNQVVKHPMDLSTIQRLFEEDNKYKRAETFASDILLMCQNCVLFNSLDEKSMKFVRMAKLLWKKFVKTLTGKTITLDVELDGIGGFVFGNMITVSSLPSEYNGWLFQITKVDHSVSNADWTTTLSAGLMRKL